MLTRVHMPMQFQHPLNFFLAMTILMVVCLLIHPPLHTVDRLLSPLATCPLSNDTYLCYAFPLFFGLGFPLIPCNLYTTSQSGLYYTVVSHVGLLTYVTNLPFWKVDCTVVPSDILNHLNECCCGLCCAIMRIVRFSTPNYHRFRLVSYIAKSGGGRHTEIAKN